MSAPHLECIEEFRPGDAKLYREAAALLLAGNCCRNPTCGWACCALATAVPHSDYLTYHRLQLRFRDVFGESAWFGKEKTVENQAARVAALLQMATTADCLAEFMP